MEINYNMEKFIKTAFCSWGTAADAHSVESQLKTFVYID